MVCCEPRGPARIGWRLRETVFAPKATKAVRTKTRETTILSHLVFQARIQRSSAKEPRPQPLQRDMDVNGHGRQLERRCPEKRGSCCWAQKPRFVLQNAFQQMRLVFTFSDEITSLPSMCSLFSFSDRFLAHCLLTPLRGAVEVLHPSLRNLLPPEMCLDGRSISVHEWCMEHRRVERG